MGLKSKLQNLFPSYRCASIMLESLDETNKQIKILQNKIADLNEKNDYLFWLSQKNHEETFDETKSRIFLDMPKMGEKTVNLLQAGTDIILKRLKKICDENNIQFFLLFGTLLGAKRHRGFIPWDDDIDIGIFYEEFVKLKEATKTDPIICLQSCYHYYWGKRIYKAKFRENDDFFVDIFIMDYVNAEGTYEEIYSHIQNDRKKFVYEIRNIIKKQNSNIIGKKYMVSLPEIDEEVEELSNEIRKTSGIYNNKGKYFCMSFEINQNFVDDVKLTKADELLPIVKNGVIFENQKYDCFNNLDYYLEKQYGDFMSLPNSILPHHDDEIHSSKEELQNFLDNIKQKLQ